MVNEQKSNDDTRIMDNPERKPAAPDWIQHEHVSDQVQLEAAKLVELVGSAELAKHAIDVVQQDVGEEFNKQTEKPAD
jgi:hypothetical protein